MEDPQLKKTKRKTDHETKNVIDMSILEILEMIRAHYNVPINDMREFRKFTGYWTFNKGQSEAKDVKDYIRAPFFDFPVDMACFHTYNFLCDVCDLPVRQYHPFERIRRSIV